MTIGIAAGLAVALAIVVAVRHRLELTLPPHLHEVDRACAKAQVRRERFETSLGLAISCHQRPMEPSTRMTIEPARPAMVLTMASATPC